MRNVGLLLTVTTIGLLSFSPVAAQSQERAPSTSTERSFHAHATQLKGAVRDTMALESVGQNQLASAKRTEENAAETTLPGPVNLNQPGSVGQSEAQPSGSGEQAETPTADELYAQLEQALDSQNWQQADQTTYELMLLIAGPKSEEQGYFDRAEWESFPCEQFQRIDSLWSEASQGQQGFAAQLTIFRQVENNPSTYFSRIGWQQEGKWVVRWQYNRTSKRAAYLPGMQPNFAEPPTGHLPALLQWSGGRDYRLTKANSCLAQ
jgi:GUN4-like